MKIAVILTSLCQGLLALAAIVAVGKPEPELWPAILSLIGAVASLIVALNGFQRYPAFVAAVVNGSTVVCYCLMPVVLGGEYKEGFALMVGSGLIVLIIGPPAINATLLVIAGMPRPVEPDAEIPDATRDSN